MNKKILQWKIEDNYLLADLQSMSFMDNVLTHKKVTVYTNCFNFFFFLHFCLCVCVCMFLYKISHIYLVAHK